MRITNREIQYIADLARLELKDEEIPTLTSQIDTILSYIGLLNELDTAGVAPTTHVLAVNNAFREDEVHSSLTQEEALANAPQQNGEAFVVPRII
jgi:aspartyl-tRNA(Asn)/glutamyl-tRNA(Gln) amidotransferase subunit C